MSPLVSLEAVELMFPRWTFTYKPTTPRQIVHVYFDDADGRTWEYFGLAGDPVLPEGWTVPQINELKAVEHIAALAPNLLDYLDMVREIR